MLYIDARLRRLMSIPSFPTLKLDAYLSIACTSAKGSILTSPPFQDLRLEHSGWRCKLHFRWWVLKNLRVDPADLTPEDPEVISCILIGNCSKWLAQAFNLATNSWNLAATSRSGLGSGSLSGCGLLWLILGQPRKTCRKVRRRVSLEISSLTSLLVRYVNKAGTRPLWVTSKGEMSFSYKIDRISLRHLKK